jgi:plasmid stabilization system protein ParE
MSHRLTAQAETDLDQIWDYIVQESGNLEIARRQVMSLTDRFFLLAKHPYLGRPRDYDLGAGRRSYPVDRYLIVYRIEGQNVLILRVIHGS